MRGLVGVCELWSVGRAVSCAVHCNGLILMLFCCTIRSTLLWFYAVPFGISGRCAVEMTRTLVPILIETALAFSTSTCRYCHTLAKWHAAGWTAIVVVFPRACASLGGKVVGHLVGPRKPWIWRIVGPFHGRITKAAGASSNICARFQEWMYLCGGGRGVWRLACFCLVL